MVLCVIAFIIWLWFCILKPKRDAKALAGSLSALPTSVGQEAEPPGTPQYGASLHEVALVVGEPGAGGSSFGGDARGRNVGSSFDNAHGANTGSSGADGGDAGGSAYGAAGAGAGRAAGGGGLGEGEDGDTVNQGSRCALVSWDVGGELLDTFCTRPDFCISDGLHVGNRRQPQQHWKWFPSTPGSKTAPLGGMREAL